MLWRTIISLWFCTSLLADSPLRVSEFSAGGRQGLIDEDGDTPDWIEIQNISQESIDLSRWTLRDVATARPWNFPATNLPAGKFLLVFASGKNKTAPGRPLHTDFKLSADRGDILLQSKAGDPTGITNYPPQIAGLSFGLPSDAQASNGPNTYLTQLTPGRSNSSAISLGPIIRSLDRTPAQPRTPDEALTITAHITPTLRDVAKVTLRYRIMFQPEIAVPMNPAQNSGSDVIYTATIPGSVAKAGQIIRYYITAEDNSGRTSRWPLVGTRPNYSVYEGTYFPSQSDSHLPIYHFFLPTRASLETARTRAVLVHHGELYDNVLVSPHGQISTNFPKPSFNLDFPHDHRFRYKPNAPRVSDLKILGNFADKSKIRNTLAYDMITASGSVGHFAFPVRIELNGSFFCVAEVVEDGDDRWLERVGLDPQGALYKMYGNLHQFSEAEKKTRKHENSSDLAALASALAEHRPIEDRVAYALDHLNIPQCISYLVALSVISSGDHGHKNYYLYRATRDSGEWSVLPWDVDLSWGRNWTKTYFDDEIYFDNPLSLYRAGRPSQGRNPLYNVFLQHPPFRQMYLRRLRTVIDQLLEPAKDSGQSVIEKRIDELINLVDPPNIGTSDADLDTQRWPSWRVQRSARDEAGRIKTEYLPARKNFLLNHATLHGDRVPAPQVADVELSVSKVQDSPSGKFVRIENKNRIAVDLSGWKLLGGGMEFIFRPGTVLPAGGTLDVVGDIRAMRSSEEFKAGTRFLQGNWKAKLSNERDPRLIRPDDEKKSAKQLPLEGELFSVEGRTAFLIPATAPAPGKPWVWYAPTLAAYPGKEERWMFEQFTSGGISIAGIDVGESYGSPDGTKLYSALHRAMTNRGYSEKPILLGRSRGGLMTLSWAAENPTKVSAWAGIYPVCNLASYPGIEKAAPAFGLIPDELQARLADFNPIDRLEPLAKARIPLFAIHGDVDTLVPLEKNSQIVHDRYTALGGSMQLIVPKGQGHNMWEGFFRSPGLVEFVKKASLKPVEELRGTEP